MNRPMPAPPAGAPNWKARGAFTGAVLAAGIAVALYAPEGGRHLTPYLDSARIPTACLGIIGPEVTRRYRLGLKFTDAECDELEGAYLNKMVAMMRACVPADVREQMTYGEWITWGRWSYNTGTASFCGSNTGKKLQAGDHAGACVAMGQWTWITRPASAGVPKGKHVAVKNTQGIVSAYRLQCRDPANRCRGLAIRRDDETRMCLEALP